MEEDLSVDDYGVILDEVYALVKAGSIFDIIDTNNGYENPEHDVSALNTALWHRIYTIEVTAIERTVAWIRYSYPWREQCRNWQPLLDAAYTEVVKRHGKQVANEFFEGMKYED